MKRIKEFFGFLSSKKSDASVKKRCKYCSKVVSQRASGRGRNKIYCDYKCQRKMAYAKRLAKVRSASAVEESALTIRDLSTKIDGLNKKIEEIEEFVKTIK